MKSLTRDALIAAVVVFIVVAGLMLIAHYLDTGAWRPGEAQGKGSTRTDWLETSRVAVPGAAVIAATVAAVIAGHGQRTRLDELESSREANVTDRYTKAIEQLGHEHMSVRIGGIYALERIGKDSTNDLPTVCRVLEEHINVRLNELNAAADEHDQKNSKDEDTTVPQPEPIPAPADLMACFKTLARLNSEAASQAGSTYDLTTIRPGLVSLDRAQLNGAYLRDAYLTHAYLRGANLTNAHLTNANLANAHLGNANLGGAHLTNAHLPDAHLTGANLGGANLDRARLSRAQVLPTVGAFEGNPQWLDEEG